MEREAFERGNLLFRDWCDMKKTERTQIMSEKKDLVESVLERVVERLTKESKMPMKTDTEDADEDGERTDKVPAFLDKGDVKKKKKGGKVPPQLQKHLKGKKRKKVKEASDYEYVEKLQESKQPEIIHPYPQLFQQKERLMKERFNTHEEIVFQELLKRAIKEQK
jgi:hypothetical protein